MAAELLDAADNARSRTSISESWPVFDVPTAYAAQDVALHRRLARGERLVGVKLGVTSRAKQKQVGVDNPSTAWLTDRMVLPAGAPVPRGRLVQPRAEPEIAFVLGARLAGPGVTAASALAAVAGVFGAIEIIDSRFSGYRFSMADVIADNTSSGFYVTGPRIRRPDELDLALEACLFEIDGEIADSATGAAVYGNPAEALAFAANTLAERGHALEPGWIVLTGGMTDAVAIRAGARIAAHFTHLGTITLDGGADADH
nr:fumarylacetoacetate hydrolase family protein [Amycolatopsis benzoatilytica]